MLESKVISNTISLLISKLIPAILLTLISILYSRNLSRDEYGIYQTVWSIISVFVILTTFGIPRYILTYGNLFAHKKKETLQLISIIFFITFSITAIILFINHSYFSLYEKGLILILLGSQSFYLIQEANIISLLSNHLLVWVNIIYSIIFFAAHLVILYFIGYKLIYFLYAAVFISVLRNVMVWNLSRQHRKTAEVQSFILFNKLQLFWFGLNDSLQVVSKWLDKIILLILLPPVSYAIYFNGTYEIPLIGIALTAFQSVIAAQSSRNLGNDEATIKLFNSSSFFMSGILFPLFSLAFVYANEIIELFYSSTYQESSLLFAISALLLPMRICSYTVLLQLKQKGSIILIGSLLDFSVMIVLMFLLYPYFFLTGLIMSVVIATYIQAIFYVYHICKSYGVSIFTLFGLDKLLLRFVFSISCILVVRHFILPNSDFNFLIATVVTSMLILYYSKEAFKDIKANKFKLFSWLE